MPSARIELTCDTAQQADAVEAALRPELGEDVPGSRSALRREGVALTLSIEAEDEGALRAALNSYLRWMQTALDVHRIARP